MEKKLLTPQIRRVLNSASNKALMLHRNGVDLDIFFDSFMEDLSLSCDFILSKNNLVELLSDSSEEVISKKRKTKKCSDHLTPKLKKFLDNCLTLTKDLCGHQDYIPPEVILLEFCDIDYMPKAFLENVEPDSGAYDDLISDITFFLSDREYIKDFWEDDFGMSADQIPVETKETHMPFEDNEILSQFAENLNKKALNGEFGKIVDFDGKIPEIATVLCRKKKPNVILTGVAGTGKTSLVEKLANDIVTGEVPELLASKVIYSVSLASMISGTELRGQFEKRLEDFINEAKKYDNIILFIDEIHTLMGAGGSGSSSLEASNILKPELARGTISCIGATTTHEYNLTIKKDSALDRRFERIIVREPSKSQMEQITPTLISFYEDFHGVVYSEEFIGSIVEYCDRFMPNKRYPDKAVDVVDHCGALVKVKHWELDPSLKKLQRSIVEKSQLFEPHDDLLMELQEKVLAWSKDNAEKPPQIGRDQLDMFFKSKMNPIYKEEVSNEIFSDIKKEFLGNDCLINKLKAEISMSILDIGSSGAKKPQVFCLNGLKGEGKTFFSSIMASKMKNSGINVVQYNGVHFSDVDAPYKILSNRDNSPSLSEKVLTFPNSVIIIDDFDRVHPSSISLFEQIFKEGKLEGHIGENIDFSHCVFVLTGSPKTSESRMGFGQGGGSSRSSINNSLSKLVTKQFSLQKLGDKDLLSLVERKLKSMKSKLRLGDIKLNFSGDFASRIVSEMNGDSPDILESKIHKYIHKQVSNGEVEINLDKFQKTA